MSRRRLLGETLAELAELAMSAGSPHASVSVRRLEMSVPIEYGLRRVGGGWQLLGDLPRTVTRTPFDTDPGRLQMVWVRGETP